MAFLHSAQLLYSDCGYPRWSVCFTLPNAIFFYMLFNNFYRKSYKSEDGAAEKCKAKDQIKCNNDSSNNDNNNNNDCKINNKNQNNYSKEINKKLS